MFEKFKNEVKKNKSKNFGFVKIREKRYCYHCSNELAAGIECLTVNPRLGNRRWYCDKCVTLMLNVELAKEMYSRVAFGDEGAAMACLEAIAEAEEELESAGE